MPSAANSGREGRDFKLLHSHRLGPELITNGDGSSTAGWTASNATLSTVGGFLRVTNTAGFGRAIQTFATVIGGVYQVKKNSQSGSAPPQVIVGSTPGGADLYNDGSTPGSATATFTATSTSTTLECIANSATVGATADFNGISVKQML